MATMRGFCEISVDGRFRSISYNTLKQYSDFALTRDVTGVSSLVGWEALKAARRDVYERVEGEDVEVSDGSGEEQSLFFIKKQKKEAEVMAHLCSMAYFELFRKVYSLVDNKNVSQDDLCRQIKNVLEQSFDKFENIVSPVSGVFDGDGLKLVSGGRAE